MQALALLAKLTPSLGVVTRPAQGKHKGTHERTCSDHAVCMGGDLLSMHISGTGMVVIKLQDQGLAGTHSFEGGSRYA